MTVYRVSPKGAYSPCTFENLALAMESLRGFIERYGVGVRVTVEVLEMTREEFDELPEHEGY